MKATNPLEGFGILIVVVVSILIHIYPDVLIILQRYCILIIVANIMRGN